MSEQALISQYVPELDTPRGQSASSRRRRLLGKEELKSLLASSTAKLQELMVKTKRPDGSSEHN